MRIAMSVVIAAALVSVFMLMTMTPTTLVSAAVAADQITSLPGFGAPPTNQYSGYLSADPSGNNNIYLHYWFVEAQTNPASAPVVLWLNGGPGCSSLEGLWNENGPLTFTGAFDSNGIPVVAPWTGSWNVFANVLYIEAPAGVGFSFAVDGNTTTDDWLTAQRNYAALLSFFKSYPEYASNDFYISGESYAGIYVPTLAYEIVTNAGTAPVAINLRGILVGNGCIGTEVGSCGSQSNEIAVKFLHGHGLFSDALYQQIMSTCTDLANPSPACQTLLTAMSYEVGPVDIYNIYAPCISDDASSAVSAARAPNPFFESLRSAQQPRKEGDDVSLPYPATPQPGPAECIDCGLMCNYLNRQDVRDAIHVQSTSKLPAWAVCSSINYSSTIESLLTTVYPTLIGAINILIYSGDTDACVPHVGTEMWTSGMGLDVMSAWHPWYVNLSAADGYQVAGYATTYAKNFSFVTVKGAGHMVPQYQPLAAQTMVSSFLNGQAL